MAYITTDEVKAKRNAIKKAFPAKQGWKFSVTREHYSSVNIILMQYPDNYDFEQDFNGVNQYSIKDSDFGDKEKVVLNKMNDIAHDGHWDESDIQSDYFNCAFYVNLAIGKWDKPVKKVPAKV